MNIEFSVVQESGWHHSRLSNRNPSRCWLYLAFGGFPAGLFVYWIADNIISLVQNTLIYVPSGSGVEERDTA